MIAQLDLRIGELDGPRVSKLGAATVVASDVPMYTIQMLTLWICIKIATTTVKLGIPIGGKAGRLKNNIVVVTAREEGALMLTLLW